MVVTDKAIDVVTGTVNTNFGVIDDCDAKNMTTESGNTIFKNTLSTTRMLKGTGSNKLTSLSNNAALTHTVMKTGITADWSASDKFGMVVFSDKNLAAGDVQFVINATTGGLQYINLPTITRGIPVFVELSKGAVTCADVIGYGFRRHCAKTFNLYIGTIVRYLAAESSVLEEIPTMRVTAVSEPTKSTVDIIGVLASAESSNAPIKLVEDTDYMINPVNKRVIWMTDQSLKAGTADYNY
ncbi:hypothetical protein [Methanobacterium spitsbergense]|uniref:Uncharacterized protein n=1 Tax=Methanobacterium spitsbergense TaxID=2874285 RepID=A0A8T5URB2_9EURY|nr:hypothetical protein [Methanobacterium spitsbergense]MBZ2166298.1 hypothetical protein [Methanobacterium spitsbergense]